MVSVPLGAGSGRVWLRQTWYASCRVSYDGRLAMSLWIRGGCRQESRQRRSPPLTQTHLNMFSPFLDCDFKGILEYSCEVVSTNSRSASACLGSSLFLRMSTPASRFHRGFTHCPTEGIRQDNQAAWTSATSAVAFITDTDVMTLAIWALDANKFSFTRSSTL